MDLIGIAIAVTAVFVVLLAVMLVRPGNLGKSRVSEIKVKENTFSEKAKGDEIASFFEALDNLIKIKRGLKLSGRIYPQKPEFFDFEIKEGMVTVFAVHIPMKEIFTSSPNNLTSVVIDVHTGNLEGGIRIDNSPKAVAKLYPQLKNISDGKVIVGDLAPIWSHIMSTVPEELSVFRMVDKAVADEKISPEADSPSLNWH